VRKSANFELATSRAPIKNEFAFSATYGNVRNSVIAPETNIVQFVVLRKLLANLRDRQSITVKR
jgi:hypothetical protein